MSADQYEADLVVLGGGMAGHTAAATAAALSARVLLLEKADEIGGSAVLSGTSLWTVPTLEALREQCPRGDLELAARVVEGYEDALAWVRASGASVGPPRRVLGYGRGHRFDVAGYFSSCRARIESAGGSVMTRSTVERLSLTDGKVSGATVRSPGGLVEVGTPAVILATGGFQGDRELLREHLGRNADRVLLRSNPWSTGDGLRLAVDAGGSLCGDMRTFYGHLMAAPIRSYGREHYNRLGTWYSEHGILLDLTGMRFTDESLGDHLSAQALVARPDARGVLVLDEFAAHTVTLNENSILSSLVDIAAAGAHVASAPTLEALSVAVGEWGFDAERVGDSLRGFNEEMHGRRPPTIPRRGARYPLVEAPFHAVEVQPAITFTQGGICVDREARVLGASGAPIEGLFAAGADMGGVYNGGYAGGLALACVFGRIAALSALSRARGRGVAT